jgi:hypothetical protein
MQRSLLLICSMLIASCMPGGGGPSPNAVLVIRADAYPITDVLEPLDALTPVLDHRIDKQPEPLYSSAYWYPHQG